MSADPDPIKILTTDAEVAGWNSDGLPNDQVHIVRVWNQMMQLHELYPNTDTSLRQRFDLSRRPGFDGEWSHRHELCSVASYHRSPASGEFSRSVLAV